MNRDCIDSFSMRMLCEVLGRCMWFFNTLLSLVPCVEYSLFEENESSDKVGNTLNFAILKFSGTFTDDIV